jgi:hypothetical protein
MLESASEAALRLPHFLERNFNITDKQRHSLWLESAQAIRSETMSFVADDARKERHALRGSITDADLAGAASVVRIRRDAEAVRFWTPDHGNADGGVIVQTLKPAKAFLPRRAVFVIDGSVEMRDAIQHISAAAEALPRGLAVSVLAAHDGVQEVLLDASDPAMLREAFAQVRPSGGHDNVPALVRAWDLAGSGGAIVWIHGPQPLLLGNLEALQQRLFWKTSSSVEKAPLLYDVQTTAGPNRVVEKLEHAWSVFRQVPRLNDLPNDLRQLFTSWSGATGNLEWVRERLPSTQDLDPERKNSKHLVRLWAFDEVKRLIVARRVGDAVKLAANYQLVTPVSGAVVLETKQQFEQAGLTPVDAGTVPSVPEPGTVALLVIGVAALLLVRLRRRTTRAA